MFTKLRMSRTYLVCVLGSLFLLTVGCGDEKLTNTSNAAPNAPTDFFPANGGTVHSLSTDLTWLCTDPQADVLTYDVHFGVEPDPGRVRQDLTESQHRVGGLTLNKTYYWRVVARDSEGNETSSEILSFTVSLGKNFGCR